MQVERSIWKAVAPMWPAIAVLVVGWALAIRTLLIEWWFNPQYQYGFLVPVLCIVLLRARMHDRPPAAPPGAGRGPALATAAICAAILAAMQPIYEANAGWRLVGGICGPAIVVFSLALAYIFGGFPWLRHFAFPVAFFLIAVPPPSSLEGPLMSRLMLQNAGATVEVLGWLGHGAVQSGNLIRLPGGTLGVEEACSGLRSLQSGIMAALFVGEFFRVGLAARAGLLMLAVATALAGNFIRTLFLAIVASSKGLKSVDIWHDPAGMTILVVIILVVWATASKLAGMPRHPAAAQGVADGLPGPSIPRGFVLAVCSVWLLAIVGTEWWFRLNERGWKSAPAWSVRVPPTARDGRQLAISDRVAEQLRYDEGISGSWIDSAGLRWQLFYFRWSPSALFPTQATTGHSPESCLAGIGMKLERRLGIRVFEKSGVRLPFRAYCFRDGHLPVHVFHAFVEDYERSETQQEIANDGSYRDRWRAVIRGARNRGQRMVEIGVWGASDIGEAEKGLKEILEHALVIDETHAGDEPRYSQRY